MKNLNNSNFRLSINLENKLNSINTDIYQNEDI